MIPNAFAISTQKDVAPLLLEGLDILADQSDSIKIATVADERIVLLQGDKQQLRDLQHTSLPQSPLGIAYHFQKTDVSPQLQFHSTEEVALVYTGQLANAPDARYELQTLGYDFEGKSDGEIVLRFLNRYLDLEVGISPLEATDLILSRLKGNQFAIMALFAKPQALLLAASCQEGALAIGVSNNSLYLSFETTILKKLCNPVMQLEKGSPILLH